MMESIIGISNRVDDSPNKSKQKDELGLDNFLKMLLSQIKNQDPLNPMEGTDFSAQLAQFSSLEQLFGVNKNLQSIMDDLNGTNRFQTMDFIGKEIVAKGDVMSLEEGGTSAGSFNLDSAADCAVSIADSDGYPVRNIYLGVLEGGQHSFEWDGRDASGNLMEPGTYEFRIGALDKDQQPVPVETRIMGRVNRVNMEGGSPILYVGKIPISVSQVIDIQVQAGSPSPD